MLLLVLALLVWFLPARWAMPWVEPHLHGVRLQQVHGLLWNGRSDQVVDTNGRPLGKVQWQLSRRALLGEPALAVQFSGPSISFAGSAHQLPDQKIEADDVTVRADLGALGLAASSPLGQPRGTLTVDVDRALLQGGWPLELQLKARWDEAVVQTHDGEVALGQLTVQAQSHSGIVQAQLRDSGSGPLVANGNLQLSPLGWRIDALMASRQPDPSLENWLAQLGAPAPDGSVHIKRSGGLASTLPPANPEQGATPP